VSLTLPAGTSYNLQVPLASATLGALAMNSGSALNVTGGAGPSAPYSVTFGATSINGSVAFNVSNNGSAAGTLNLGALNDLGQASSIAFGGNGTVNLNAAGSLSGGTTATIASGATLAVNASAALGSNGIGVSNSGVLEVYANQTLGAVSGAGSVIVGNGLAANTLTFAANTTGISMSALTINGSSALDLNNNHFFINFGANPDPIAMIRQYLVNGFNNGLWNGAGGIDSSAANSSYGIGYADGSDGIVTGLLPGQIEVAYTLYGDANLDGVVNGADFTILASNLGKAVFGWDKADFLYTGAVSGADFTALVGNLGKSASGADVVLPAADYAAIDAFAAANGLMADVPEPAAASLLALNVLTLLLRRQRNGKRSRFHPNTDRSASNLWRHL
jgi:hypothetical protein